MFQVVFFRTDAGGEPARDFVRELPPEDRFVVGSDLKTVQFGFPLGMPLCRPMGRGLHELRSSLPSRREVRLLFFVDGREIVVVEAFVKKTARTPPERLAVARERMAIWQKNRRTGDRP